MKNKKIETKESMLKKMMISSIISIFLSIIMIILFSICLHSLSKLSIINPWIFFLILIAFLIYNVITLLISIRNKFKEDMVKSYFKFYDIINFITKSILILSTILMFFITPTTVSGNSMNDTLSSGDKLLVWHMGYSAKKDDIVIINVTKKKYGAQISKDDSLYIKRVVATQGDIVTYDQSTNEFKVNGVIVEKSLEAMSYYYYIKCINLYGKYENIDYTFEVPKGYSIVMGDHRTNSMDSRELGLIDNNDILGKACIRLLPFTKLSKKISYE